MNFLRRSVPNRIKRRLKIALGLPLTRLHPDWAILRHIGPVHQPHVIIDAGSHHGWFFHCWKDWCPSAKIHAFEPDINAAQRSIALYGSNPDVRVNEIALGAERGEKEFNFMPATSVSSSFLEPNLKTWKEIGYKIDAIKKLSVPVMKLDDYVRENQINSIYLLKIDVQGYEDKTLLGACHSLQNTDYVFVESAVKPLYKNAPTFSDIVNLLLPNFDLIALRAWHRGNRVLIETDLLFRRRDLSPPINPAFERIMEEL